VVMRPSSTPNPSWRSTFYNRRETVSWWQEALEIQLGAWRCHTCPSFTPMTIVMSSPFAGGNNDLLGRRP